MVYIALAAALALVGIDQLLKYLIVQNMAVGTTIPVLQIGDKDILNITYHQNTGAAFSILQDKRWFLILMTAIVILIAIGLLVFKKIKNPWLIWIVSVIIAGGAGNLVDRIFRGFVVDYIDVRIINFAVFNFADCCVVVGTASLLLYILVFDIRRTKHEKAAIGTVQADAEQTAKSQDNE